MVRTAIPAKAALLLAAIVGPTWSAASVCPFDSTGSLAIESRTLRPSTPPVSRGVREITGQRGRHMSGFGAQRLSLDEIPNRHFFTYLELKEKP